MPTLLDLFCKAGGCSEGYRRAGFDVTGVDIEDQPTYRARFGTFVQADALTFPLDGFDVVHASPPCQANILGLGAVNRALGRVSSHVDLIPPVRARLLAAGVPYVIENVVGANLRGAVRLCGSSFGLPIHRHRLFESSELLMVPDCEHDRLREAKYWTSTRKKGEAKRAYTVQVYGNGGERHEWGPALGIDWMNHDELIQAIPPAYTECLGVQLLRVVEARRAA